MHLWQNANINETLFELGFPLYKVDTWMMETLMMLMSNSPPFDDPVVTNVQQQQQKEDLKKEDQKHMKNETQW